MHGRVVTVFGGTGFIGRPLVGALAAHGARVRVAVRDVERVSPLKILGDLGQIAPITASLTHPDSVHRAVEGADAVVNLVGILSESGRQTFQSVHVEGARTVARAAAQAGVGTLVHMSALGACADSPARYAQSKAAGEAAVREAVPQAAIVRPSVVFGPDDRFFNLFASFTRFSPVLPYFDRGGSLGSPRFQPVFVGDVVQAITTLVETPRPGETFELGGPQVYSMREIMELIVRETHRATRVIKLPFWVAQTQAALLGRLPNPLLTPDQVLMLQKDNVLSGACPGLEALGIEPQAVEAVVPSYLSRFRPLHRHVILRDT
ncbi:complex I NDUFA9 subunit family protein [Pararhodospirillum photometricum]|nr:complex I NDUFA9 subunit family protein [Pararhodospirillum photometricum]